MKNLCHVGVSALVQDNFATLFPVFSMKDAGCLNINDFIGLSLTSQLSSSTQSVRSKRNKSKKCLNWIKQGSQAGRVYSDCRVKPHDDLNYLEILAVNSLDLGAPASHVLLSYRSEWFQLSGHPDSFAPATPGTVWKKKIGIDNRESDVYSQLMNDVAKSIVPVFYREIEYKGGYFIEMEDLLFKFRNPNVMDIKMGTRTFLESEANNTNERQDLYEKMKKVDPSAPTPDEHCKKAVTKLRYMVFRENQSSSSLLGFRVEALKLASKPPVTDLKTIKHRSEVLNTMYLFFHRNDSARKKILKRLKEMRSIFEKSPVFSRSEVVGSSILIIHDQHDANAWMIDFVKTVPVPDSITVNHRTPWTLGNHEEGYLLGLDNLIDVIKEVGSMKQA